MKFKDKDWLKKWGIRVGIVLGIILLIYFIWLLFIEKPLIFKNEEKQFIKGAKEYFERYPKKLPDKEGKYTELKLSTLYDLSYVPLLTIPKKTTSCSIDSWIRVTKEKDNTYKYHVYLECGKRKSKIDHTPPVITLEGDINYYIKVGDKYTDPGVKSVTDNKDKHIDISKVSTDSSAVDMNQIGEYQVKYLVMDSTGNKATTVRNVHVTRNLLDEVKAKTDSSNIYKGTNAPNYVFYSGMLFRIIGVNPDNSIKLMTDDNISNISYGEAPNFIDSHASTWLNEYFYPNLKNSDKFVKQDSTWCLDTYNSVSDSKNACTKYSEAKPVGLLSTSEYFNTYDSSGKSYLNNRVSYWLLNKNSTGQAYMTYSFSDDKLMAYNDTELVGVRPVINIIGDKIFIVSGNGTGNNPYKLNDYEYGRDADLLNTRLVGEYVVYSGQFFRIAGFDKEGNTKLVTAGTILNNSTNRPITASYNDADTNRKFSPTVAGNLGYNINHEVISYLDEKFLMEHEFSLPTYENGKIYNSFKTETFKAKLSIPASYELFSALNNNELFLNYNYWLLDNSLPENKYLMLNTGNGIVFEVGLNDYKNNAIKVALYMPKHIKLSGGQGTVLTPYYVK
ncbi:MAG: DUF5011 domain-containing protein [Bacilli bacterium]